MSSNGLKEHADGGFCEDCDRGETCYTCPVTKNLISKILGGLFGKKREKDNKDYIEDNRDYIKESKERQKILYNRK